MTFCTFDLGKKNTAVAFFKNEKLINFETFPLTNLCDFSKLDQYKDFLNEATSVYIEQQFSRNTRAKIIEGQLKLWFFLNFANLKVSSFSASAKYTNILTQIVSKHKRKAIAVKFISNWLNETSCDELKKKFASLKKKDDVADAILIGYQVIFKNHKTSKNLL